MATETGTRGSHDTEEGLEIEQILKGEESLLTREQEVERVVAAFKLNPYEILGLDMTNPASITEAVIRKTYRQKSLLIHPDKLAHPRGVEAFDLLKKAEGFLLDPEKRRLEITLTSCDDHDLFRYINELDLYIYMYMAMLYSY